MSSYSEKMLAALKDEDLGEANLLFEEALNGHVIRNPVSG